MCSRFSDSYWYASLLAPKVHYSKTLKIIDTKLSNLSKTRLFLATWEKPCCTFIIGLPLKLRCAWGISWQSFQIIICLTVILLRPKTLLNQFLSDSKATLKQSIKRFFNSDNGQSDPADGQNLSKYNKNTKNLAKKYDFRLRKFKNIESPKMVSKRLNGQY